MLKKAEKVRYRSEDNKNNFYLFKPILLDNEFNTQETSRHAPCITLLRTDWDGPSHDFFLHKSRKRVAVVLMAVY